MSYVPIEPVTPGDASPPIEMQLNVAPIALQLSAAPPTYKGEYF